jgi:hypothetical protein
MQSPGPFLNSRTWGLAEQKSPVSNTNVLRNQSDSRVGGKHPQALHTWVQT